MSEEGGASAAERPSGKKAATRSRIAEAGLRLFLERGYDATTVDEIAAAAQISRRTFFDHFRSKDEVLLEWGGTGAISSNLTAALVEQSSDQDPLRAAARALISLAARYETDESRAVDALMQSSESLRKSKGAAEADLERTLAQAMSALWPDPSRASEVRIAAMIATGILRLSLDDWRQDDPQDSLAGHLERNFRAISALAECRGARGRR